MVLYLDMKDQGHSFWEQAGHNRSIYYLNTSELKSTNFFVSFILINITQYSIVTT